MVPGIKTMLWGNKDINEKISPFLPKLSTRKATEKPKQKPLKVIYNGETTAPKYVNPDIKSITVHIILLINDILNVPPLYILSPGIRLKNPSTYLISRSFESIESLLTQKAPKLIPRENKIKKHKYQIPFSLICLAAA